MDVDKATETNVVYAGFRKRLSALLLDGLILSPVAAVNFFINARHPSWMIYSFIPISVIFFVYNVFPVKRYGGTPGKLILKIEIRMNDLTPVTWTAALLRCFLTFVWGMVRSVMELSTNYGQSDDRFTSMSFLEAMKIQSIEASPYVHELQKVSNVCFVADALTFFFNKKHRALHDLIAGTVVIVKSPAPKDSVSA